MQPHPLHYPDAMSSKPLSSENTSHNTSLVGKDFQIQVWKRGKEGASKLNEDLGGRIGTIDSRTDLELGVQ